MTRRNIAIVLFCATFLLFIRSAMNGYVLLDDDRYLFNNAQVRGGLTWSGIQWAFSSFTLYYWQPLTWISHMVDVSIFGLNPGPHHVVGALLHAVNTALVFVLISRFTGNMWAGILGALFFGWHPLRVESVAWASERKDLLSAFFWLLTCLSYERYGREGSPRHLRLAMGMMFLGMLAKPTIVTLPLALLLMDYWPLRRKEGLAQLLWEKAPFFVMAAVSAGLTYYSQVQHEANVMPVDLELSIRLSNAIVSYTRYLAKIVAPVGLLVLYPYKVDLPVASVVISLLVSCGITFYCWRQRERRPNVWMGWLWFVAVLLPTSGVVQSGSQSMADRFTYIPMIGLALAVMGTIAEKRWAKAFLVVAAVYGVLTFQQIGLWRNSETLFTNTLAGSPDNPLIQYALGHALMEENRFQEAIPHFEETVRMMPDYPKAKQVLAGALQMAGRGNDALAQAEEALRKNPESGRAYVTLGDLRMRNGQSGEAQSLYEQALTKQLSSEDQAAAHTGLGTVLMEKSRPQDAEKEFRSAIAAGPQFLPAHRSLVTLLVEQGRSEQALAHLMELSKRMPGNRDLEQLMEAIRSTIGR